MNPPNRNTTEMVVGSMYVREDLLRQEAQNSRMGGVTHRVARWVRTITRIMFVLLVAGIPAAIALGPGVAIGWFVTYLIPTLVILGVVVGTIFLVAREGGKVYDTRYPHK
jgi:hypothetical protein